MQILGFQEAVTAITRKDSRYLVDGYFFLRDVLEVTIKRRRKLRKKNSSPHISAPELLEGFRIHALKEFGPMAVTVLEYWGIKNSEDVGQMIFYLIETGVLGKTENDTQSSFANVLDFEKAFILPFKPAAATLISPALTQV